MHRTVLPLVLWLSLIAGCGDNKQTCSTTTKASLASAVTESQTRAIGACGCVTDADCAAEIDAGLLGLKTPRRLDRKPVGSACVARGVSRSFAREAACFCYYGWGPSYERRFENAQILGNRTTCDVPGRSLDCLYPATDFPGCDPTNATSCEGICADLDARIQADDARTFDVERRTSRCAQPSCLCQNVFRIEQRCYTNNAPFQTPYDCNRSDEDILASAYPPPPSPPLPPTPSSPSSSPLPPNNAASVEACVPE